MALALHTVSDAAAWLAARLPSGRPGSAGTLRTDSRAVRAGDVFIAWPGAATDGRQYVAGALAAGAAACLVEDAGVQAFGFDDDRIASLPGLKAATGPLAAQWFGQPAGALAVVAATGTNGKSSTAWWTAQALTLLGRPCEVAGTLGIGRPPLGSDAGTVDATGLTTPDPITLQAAFARMVAQGVAACAIEASSIGLAEHRLAGTPITVAQFTNFTQDHLDYHGSMAAYWDAKRALFDWPGLRAAVINLDDPKGAELAAQLRGPEAWTYSLQRDARLRFDGAQVPWVLLKARDQARQSP